MSQIETPHDDGDIVYPAAIPFVLVHLACLGAIWSGVTWTSVWLAIGLYWLRMFAVTGGYHRYFSHRTYKISRFGQFLLALLAQSTAQKSVLWWASKHRHHHRYADTEHDVHSPVLTSFVYSHLGWIFARGHARFDPSTITDLTKFQELRLLHRFEIAPAVLLALICFAIDGWAGLFVGFFWSTVCVFHATFCINSLAHVHGDKDYVTGDESRNNWWLAVITMGEGWHNNHHAYQYSVRQGFRWWQWDPTYYIILGLSKLGLVWELREPPQAVIERSQALPPRVIERSAERLAASVPLERAIAAFWEAYAATPSLSDLNLPTMTLADLRTALADLQHRAGDRLVEMQQQAHEALAQLHLPVLPTREELAEKAAAMFVKTPSLDAIAARAHDLLTEAMYARLVSQPSAAPPRG
ncbi:stearoyl-CoA desaturase (delta-9 desaturase) [Bosea sp. OK403]|uniref:acyl-CoA desaturase n=1 Tax=Bosea sp. OK403 TaxID=1855286 RepID=UPI0008F21C94|nr:acyl-CoA desaturase [Bosea sp. OK403]SFI02890.1 stearoyl-CoA desaturase (delta-9 desaturase) [Bosea sp. OK403]